MQDGVPPNNGMEADGFRLLLTRVGKHFWEIWNWKTQTPLALEAWELRVLDDSNSKVIAARSFIWKRDAESARSRLISEIGRSEDRSILAAGVAELLETM